MTSAILDDAAFTLLQTMAQAENHPGARARRAVDAAVDALHALVRRRLLMLVIRHGLADMREDAEQACLIALVDAAQRWDPARSAFSTWLGWHIRGVLVGLRRQWLGDSRTASGRQRAATVSLDGDIGAMTPSDWIADPLAEDDTARGAADWLAIRCADRLAAGCDANDRAAWLARLVDDAERCAPALPPQRRRH